MNIKITSPKQGFTLMEIMVVIIVIAVLASVAGPMIGSITDQGKASATKATMQNIKTALVNYNNDLGKFPFKYTTSTSVTSAQAYNDAWNLALGQTMDSNVLVNNSAGGTWGNLGMSASVYARRWKGPYMDSDPSEFMVDAWLAPIEYVWYRSQLFLHSNGPDGVTDFTEAVTNTNSYTGDDIVMSVTRTKF